MAWIKVIFCLCLTTSVISTKADNSKKESSLKEEDNNSRNSQQLQINKTEKEVESLEESPSESIRFRKPIIFQGSEERFSHTDKNYRERTGIHENNERAKSAKDLTDEENIYRPVLTFTEVPNLQRYWKIVPEAPSYRARNQLKSALPIAESHAFLIQPKIPSEQMKPSHTGNIEGRNMNHPESRDYPHYDSHPPRYPDSDNPPGHGHSVHTETTHDYGRFLNVDYKSKIEQEAEAMIKSQKAKNATNNPQQNNEENRQTTPSRYHGRDQRGNKAFFHLGNIQAPYSYKYPDVLHHQNQGYHYTSEEYPKTEKYPIQPYTYSPRKPAPPNVGQDYYTPRNPISSTETYQPQLSHPAKEYSVHRVPPNAPRQYDSSTEQYPPTHSTAYQKEPPPYPGTTPHSPRQYSTSAEQLPPQYQSGERHIPSSYSDDSAMHNQPAQIPPQYNSGEKNYPISYTEDFQHPAPYPNPPTKEFHEPYSNNPREPSLPAAPPPPPSPNTPHFIENPHPQTNQAPTKSEQEILQERAYYNTYRSLMDLYKSFGFQPLNFDEMPELLPNSFAYGSTFRAKIPISSPVSSSVSTEDYSSNPKVPTYINNANANHPVDKSYDNYRQPYTKTKYQDNKENYERNTYSTPDYTQTYVPLKNTDGHYQEQVPYDSNRSPIVSTEHYDNSEISRPSIFNTQVESPKEPFLQDEYQPKVHPNPKSEYASPEGIKVRGFRINDYNPETFFYDPSHKSVDNYDPPHKSVDNYDPSHKSVDNYGPPHKNVDNSAYQYSSISSADSPPHSHSIVRKNPYHLESPFSTEVIATNRPRIYKHNHNFESPPYHANPGERINDFENNEKINKFQPVNIVDTNEDASFVDDGSNRPNESKPKNTSPEYKNNQWKQNTADKHPPQAMKGGVSHNGHRNRHNKRKIPFQNSENTPFQEDSSYEQQDQRSGRTTHGDSRSKTKGKRTSHKKPRKHKPKGRSQSGDQLRAEGSTYHWGMEKHKGTDGFFQYANVPGAKAFEFGYRMGGPEKTEERYHRTKGIQSKIKMNWEDGNGDTGDHYWEFNHDSREDDTEERKPKEEKEEKKSQSDEDE